MNRGHYVGYVTYGSGEGQFNDQRPESVSPNCKQQFVSARGFSFTVTSF